MSRWTIEVRDTTRADGAAQSFGSDAPTIQEALREAAEQTQTAASQSGTSATTAHGSPAARIPGTPGSAVS